MLDDPDALHAALRARDPRFDGRFFVGVRSTGIYCRPVCAVRTPRPENCSFHASAAAAEARGFRPCLRCRPELAPGRAAIDAGGRHARLAADLVEQGFLDEHGCAALAARLGLTDRHLRRIFQAHWGTTPSAWARTRRLLLAKRLLADTALDVTTVAMTAGFGSLSRFNALMKRAYGLAPGAMRGRVPVSGSPTFHLAYRPPFDFPWLLQWVARHAAPGVEALAGGRLLRALSLQGPAGVVTGWVAVDDEPARHRVRVTVSAALLPVLDRVLACVRRMLDLDAAPDEIAAVLGPLAADRPGVRLPALPSGFEAAVRAVCGQQVSVAAACTLTGRLVARLGQPLAEAPVGLTHAFPSARALAGAGIDALAALGFPRGRAEALHALACAVAEGRLELELVPDVDAGRAALRALPGVGPWTADWIAIRGWAWPDIFPAGDLVLRRTLARLPVPTDPTGWRPWRSYAAFHLWRHAASGTITS